MICLVLVSGSFLQRLLFIFVCVAFDLLQALPWYLSMVADIGLCGVFASIDVLCLLFVSSNQFVVLSSLVGHSSFVTTPSSVSGCLRVLLLRSVTHSDLRFSLTDGVARWDESLMFLFAPSSLLRFRQAFVGSLVFLLVSVSGIFFLPSSFAWIHSTFSVGGCRSLHLFCIFLFIRPSCIIYCVSSPILYHFYVFLSGVSLRFPSVVWVFSLPGLSHLVPKSLRTWSLRI